MGAALMVGIGQKEGNNNEKQSTHTFSYLYLQYAAWGPTPHLFKHVETLRLNMGSTTNNIMSEGIEEICQIDFVNSHRCSGYSKLVSFSLQQQAVKLLGHVLLDCLIVLEAFLQGHSNTLGHLYKATRQAEAYLQHSDPNLQNGETMETS